MNIWEIFTGQRYKTGRLAKGDTRQPVNRRSLTATDEEWEYIEEISSRNGISSSAYIRLLIMIDQTEGGLTPEKVHNKKQLKDLQVG